MIVIGRNNALDSWRFLTIDWDQLAKIRQRSWKERLTENSISCQVWKWSLLKTNQDIVLQSREILQTFVSWWGASSRPHHSNVRKILRLCVAVPLLASNVPPLNLVSFLILKRSFQQYQWIFAYSGVYLKVDITYKRTFSGQPGQNISYFGGFCCN